MSLGYSNLIVGSYQAGIKLFVGVK